LFFIDDKDFAVVFFYAVKKSYWFSVVKQQKNEKGSRGAITKIKYLKNLKRGFYAFQHFFNVCRPFWI